ncbi:hypothetical protein CLAIMM_00786 [Cladophialophora immunda]|nr:hypothetical protein CLAIMM_00786 [Cladophialophora immunda]
MVKSRARGFLHPARKAWKQVFSTRHEDMCNTPQPPHPDGHILAIFNKSNFSRLDIIRGLEKPIDTWLDPKYAIDDTFYDRIRPALVLATRFFTWTSEFFNILVFGGFIFEGSKMRYDRFTELELGSRGFPTLMDSLCNKQFFTGYHQNSRVDTYASTYFGLYPKDCPSQIATTAVQLNTKFTTFFTHYHYDKYSDDVKNMVIVSLAITLVHELVHVWYTLRRMELARLGDLALCIAMEKEPYFFGNERTPELGLSWEHFAFRGMPQLDHSGGGPYAEAKGLRLIPLLKDSDQKDEAVVDSEVLRALLDEECWEVYERLLIGDLAATYRTVRGMGILERMKTVVELQAFKNKTGRLPSLQELLRSRDVALPSEAGGQQFAKVHLLDLSSPKSTLSTEVKATRIAIVVGEGSFCSSPVSYTSSDEQRMDFADQWASVYEAAISNPLYLADRALKQKRIQKAQLGWKDSGRSKKWSRRVDETTPSPCIC